MQNNKRGEENDENLFCFYLILILHHQKPMDKIELDNQKRVRQQQKKTTNDDDKTVKTQTKTTTHRQSLVNYNFFLFTIGFISYPLYEYSDVFK